MPEYTSFAPCVLGVALLLTDGYVAQLAGALGNLFGVVLAAGCAASIAFYMVWMRPIIMRHGTLRITTLSMAIGTLGLWLLVGIPTNQ